MKDAQQELHQRSLRNVRALLEKEQQEFARQKRARRLLIWIALPVLLLVAGLVYYGARKNPSTREPAEKLRIACETEVWAAKSGDAERAIRAANPGIAPPEVARRLQQESPTLQAAAAEECRRRLAK
jgi:hypothetical protein